jgi:two-component system LytT family sensor kinase
MISAYRTSILPSRQRNKCAELVAGWAEMSELLHRMAVGWKLKLRQGGWGILWLITCFWVVMAVVSSLQTYYFFSTMKEGPPAIRAVMLACLFSLLWALVTPLVLLLARIFPIERATMAVNLPLHLLFSVLVGISVRLVFLLSQVSIPAIRPMRPLTLDRAMSDIITSFDYQAMVYWVMLAIYQGAIYYRKYQEGKLLSSQLETQLVQAQLSGLRMQLQPHFLFNTLHTINSMMYESTDRASEMIVRLSEFLRLSLENNGEQEVPLSRELDFIERYLEIERARFEDRLNVEYQIEPDTYDFLVPNLLLQPLVENAIKHGISRVPGGGKLVIGAKLRNQTLSIFVANSGPFLASDPLRASEQDPQSRRGIGIANTSARLRALYGEAHYFELRNWHEGGVEALVSIPARLAESTEPSPPPEREESLIHESSHRG